MAISVADNFSYKGAKPLDARTKYATVADMKNATASDLYDGCLAYVTATKKNYQFDSSNTVDPDTGKWRELQTGGGGGTTYTAGDGINITNDEISVKEMASADMSEVIDPLPSVMSRKMIYSTAEQVVGQWTDGKPVYQKTVSILGESISASTRKYYDLIELSSGEPHFIRGWGTVSYTQNNDYYIKPLNTTIYNDAGSQITLNSDIYYDGRTNQNKIRLRFLHNISSEILYDFYVTVQYTKSTD